MWFTLTGEEFFKYIESEISRNIVLDAIAKKVSVDEAYKICREHGITPTVVNEPYGSTTKPVVEKVTLSPELFFDQMFVPFGRGANFTSNPETYKDVESFINDCDCRELIIPAEDAVLYQNINGIHIPENYKIKGRFPNVVKLVKEEQVEELGLSLEQNNSLGCNVYIKGFWGNRRSRITIEMPCINIDIVHDNEVTNFKFSFRYPHLTADAISDLSRLELLASGCDFVFSRANVQYKCNRKKG